MTPSCKWPIVTSPLAKESKTVLNYGLPGLASGFQGLDSGFQGLDSGFQYWIPDSRVWIPDSRHWIPDSRDWIMDSRDWIPDSLLVELGLRIPTISRDAGFLELYSGFH